MMRKLGIILAVLAGVLLGCLLYLLWAPGNDAVLPPPPGPDPVTASRSGEGAHPVAGRWPFGSRRPRPVATHIPASVVFREDPSAPAVKRFPGRDRIPGEYVLSFYDERDRAAFIEAARKAGAEILGQTKLGYSVRLKLPSRDALKQLIKNGPEPIDYGANYYTRLPKPIDPEEPRAQQSGYIGFGDAALPWLGVQGDNANWGQGVTIAVLDTGVGSHAALPESQIMRLDMVGDGLGISGTHGTSVASLLIGDSDDIKGLAPSASVLSIRVLSEEGGGDVFTLASAIVEAVDRGSSVINISLGSYGDSYLLSQAIEYAAQNDVTIVASSGNDAVSGVTYPAAYDEVIAVGAVDGAARHAYFSNRGDEVDLAAPGIGLYAAGEGDGTVTFSGTSAAAPLVAGTVAALLASDPSMTAAEAVDAVLSNTDDHGAPGEDTEFGSGTLNVGRIESRDTPGIYDVAVGDAFVVSEGDQHTITLYVQNRGTEPLVSVDMVVTIDGVESLASFSNLEVGATAARTYDLVGENLSAYGEIPVAFEATISGTDDIYPANNASSGAVTIAEPGT